MYSNTLATSAKYFISVWICANIHVYTLDFIYRLCACEMNPKWNHFRHNVYEQRYRKRITDSSSLWPWYAVNNRNDNNDYFRHLCTNQTKLTNELYNSYNTVAAYTLQLRTYTSALVMFCILTLYNAVQSAALHSHRKLHCNTETTNYTSSVADIFGTRSHIETVGKDHTTCLHPVTQACSNIN